MNWEAIGAIGEIIGAISVLATLIFLSSATAAKHNCPSATKFKKFSICLQQVSASMMDPNVSGM